MQGAKHCQKDLFLQISKDNLILIILNFPLQVKEPNDYQVSILLANLSGYRSAMFTHQLALDANVKTLVETYKEPIKQGLMLVKSVLTQCVHECCTSQVRT